MNKRIFDKFSKEVQHMVIWSKAASIELMVDCLYPESLAIGLLTIGKNDVTKLLIDEHVDIASVVKSLKVSLSKKSKNNAEKSLNSYSNLNVSRQVFDIFRKADKISEDLGSQSIHLQHVFVSIIDVSKNVRGVFEKHGMKSNDIEEKALNIDNAEKESVRETPSRRVSTKGKTKSALKEFCVDITEQAQNNELDPIIAREKEIETAITILCRRNKNNPVLLGDPGVGKTAIVEGIAQRIVSGTVPDQIKNHKIFSLNLGSMVAGTKYRGDFEDRIDALVQEIQSSDDVILFVDEIHTIMGAGGAQGSLDASNILKPFLTKNKLKCIGATTLAEYKKYFKKDGALERRFQQVIIEEPTKEQTVLILSGIKDKLEEYHGCSITSEAIMSVVELTDRFMSYRNFPDKAIDCLDTACAKYAWVTKKSRQPISRQDIEMVVSELCKIPIEILSCDKNERIESVRAQVESNIIGQSAAIDIFCRVLKSAYSGVRNPMKPIGSFVFGGQSGTGKTYMAKQLSEAIFGNKNAFIKLDMTEFTEQHSVSKLIGSPPGYVGFSESDVFIDRVKRNPYCIVLLDEIEKAHPFVIKTFLQVMSEGIMTDATGDVVNFKNVVLIMTGNFGMNVSSSKSLGFVNNKNEKEVEQEQDRLISFCEKQYGSEFINRVDEFVPFMPLSKESLMKIAEIQLGELANRVESIPSVTCKVSFDEMVYDLLLEKSTREHGKNATMINRLISKEIEPCLSSALISVSNDCMYQISITSKDSKFVSEIKTTNE